MNVSTGSPDRPEAGREAELSSFGLATTWTRMGISPEISWQGPSLPVRASMPIHSMKT